MTENSAITSFFQKIGKIPLLTKDEETALFQRIETGDVSARDELIERNLKLVIPTAKRYMRCGIPFADLVQEGSRAIVTACDKFDWRKGNKFSTYATYWIQHHIGRYVKKHSKNVFVPEYVVNLAIQINKVRASLAQEGVDEPSEDAVAERLTRDFKTNATRDEIKDAVKFCQAETSLSARIGEDGESEFGDFIEDESATDPGDESSRLESGPVLGLVLNGLSDQEKDIIALRFGVGLPKGGLTVPELAERFHGTESEIETALAAGKATVCK